MSSALDQPSDAHRSSRLANLPVFIFRRKGKSESGHIGAAGMNNEASNASYEASMANRAAAAAYEDADNDNLSTHHTNLANDQSTAVGFHSNLKNVYLGHALRADTGHGINSVNSHQNAQTVRDDAIASKILAQAAIRDLEEQKKAALEAQKKAALEAKKKAALEAKKAQPKH